MPLAIHRSPRSPRAGWVASAAVVSLLLAACTGGAPAAGPAAVSGADVDRDTTVKVQSRPVASQFVGYARVVPIAALPVRTVQPGVVSGLAVVPGTAVRAGQRLAELSGPEIRALEVRSEGDVRGAQATLAAATRTLAIDRRQLPLRLVTRQQVAYAQSALASAEAALASAQAQLQTVRRMSVLQAPSAGTVLSVDATDGERVAAGQTILTLETNDRLWLQATLYGADAAALRPGTLGRFVPDTGSQAPGSAGIAVRVATVFHTLQADGGETVGLLATAPADWLSGETGVVTLEGPVRSLVEVPTRALVLDQGQWWVLVRTQEGDRRQKVLPGPARGWQTFIEQGLSPGDTVVVQNAYLEFHRGIAGHYQPPD